MGAAAKAKCVLDPHTWQTQCHKFMHRDSITAALNDLGTENEYACSSFWRVGICRNLLCTTRLAACSSLVLVFCWCLQGVMAIACTSAIDQCRSYSNECCAAAGRHRRPQKEGLLRLCV